MTIAGFLAKVDPDTLDFGTVIVVDEASMIDVILMYRLLRHMPAWVRLILVGDPSQLPPIGPGLVLHSLTGVASIPQTELTTVMRQTSESGIPKVAAAIRDHKAPLWTRYSGNEMPACHSFRALVPIWPRRSRTSTQNSVEMGPIQRSDTLSHKWRHGRREKPQLNPA